MSRFARRWGWLAVLVALIGVSCADARIESVRMPALAGIPDGTYVGRAFRLPVYAKVAITLESGRITSFRILRHFSSEHGKPAERLAAAVVERQSVQIDAVSGATYSSGVILKAGELALRSAR